MRRALNGHRPHPRGAAVAPRAPVLISLKQVSSLADRDAATLLLPHGTFEPSSSSYDWNTHACTQSKSTVELEIHAFLPPMKINVSLPLARHALAQASAAVFDSVLRIAQREISGPAADLVKQTIGRALEQAANARFGAPMHELGRMRSCSSRVLSGTSDSRADAATAAGTSVTKCTDHADRGRLFHRSGLPLRQLDAMPDSLVPCFLRESICASDSQSGAELTEQCISGPDCRNDGSACLHQGGRFALAHDFRERARTAVRAERNASFKCNLGITPFGYSYTVARPDSFGARSRMAVVGHEVLQYRLDIEEVDASFVVRCPFGHAIDSIHVVSAGDASAASMVQGAVDDCVGKAELCVVYVPSSVSQRPDVSLDVFCKPASFLASSVLSVMSRERDRWLWWWTRGGKRYVVSCISATAR